MCKAFLDEVGHPDLGSLLILHQNIMRGGDLVSLETIQQCHADHSRWREKSVSVIDYVLHLHFAHHWICICLFCLCLYWQMLKQGKDGGLHFNIPHSGIISFPQILQFFFMGEGTDGSVESALTYRDRTGFVGMSSPNSLGVTCMWCLYLHRSHGVSNDAGKLFKLGGALQELIGHSLVQLGAPGDDFTQNHLLKLGAEGIVHRFVCDHHRARSQT